MTTVTDAVTVFVSHYIRIYILQKYLLRNFKVKNKYFFISSVCYCGQCLMEMLKEGDTGSIWIVEDKEIYEIEIPERISLKKIK